MATDGGKALENFRTLASKLSDMNILDGTPKKSLDGFAKALLDLTGRPGATSNDPEFNMPIKEMKEESESSKHRKRVSKARRELHADVAKKLTENASSSPTFMLKAPKKLTVASNKHGYFMETHVGGEEFVLDSAKVTTESGRVIACFRPTEAAAYKHAELFLKDAVSCLSGFEGFLTSVIPDYYDRLENLEKIVQEDKEAADFKKHQETYEGFGSW